MRHRRVMEAAALRFLDFWRTDAERTQLQDPFHQQKTSLRGQLRPTMGHESLLSVGVHTPTVMEALAVSTTLVGTTARSDILGP